MLSELAAGKFELKNANECKEGTPPEEKEFFAPFYPRKPSLDLSQPHLVPSVESDSAGLENFKGELTVGDIAEQ